MVLFRLIWRKLVVPGFLHITDNATRFSKAAVVRSKRKEEIVDAFIKNWIVIFGAPGVILPDNGSEFSNSLFLNMAEEFNITLKTNAGDFPWLSGMVERYIDILAKTVEKLTIDTNNKYFLLMLL